MQKKPKRIKPKPGDVFEMELAPGYKGYGRAVIVKNGYNSLLEFYQLNPTQPHSLEQLKGLDVLFIEWGSYAMISTGEWPIVGHIPLPEDYNYPHFYQNDPYNKRCYLIYDVNDVVIARVNEVEYREWLVKGNLYSWGFNGYGALKIYYLMQLKAKQLVEDTFELGGPPEVIMVEIFDADLAADVRSAFEKRLKKSNSVEETTAFVLKKFKFALEDTDDEPIIFLALAALQLEQGAIQEQVRARALEIIDSGQDLQRWEEESTEIFEARKQVLLDLKAKIKGNLEKKS
jgi:hypothetical protein